MISSRPAWLDSPRVASVLFAIAALVVGAALVSLVRGFTFFGDEWAFVVSRREYGVDALLRPHNEHWQALPIGVYQVVFALRGLSSYGMLAASSTMAHLFAATMLFVLLRTRVHPWLALAGAIGFLCFAWSDEVLLWPVNMSFSLPVGFGLAAILAWDRDAARTWSDALGAAAMTAAFASGGIAIVFWIVATASLVRRSRTATRLAWPAVSLLVYLLWYLAFGAAALGDTAGFDAALLPSFIADGLAGLAAPLIGLDFRFRLPALALLAAGIGAAVGWLHHRDGNFWIPISGLLLLFGLIGVARLAKYDVEGAEAPRYLYPAAALAFLALTPLVEAVRRRCGAGGRRILWLGVGIWLVVSVAGDIGKLARSAEVFAERTTQIRTELRTLQVLRPVLEGTSAASRPFDPNFFFGLTPDGYYRAIDDLTPPLTGATAASMVGLPPQERERADRLIASLFHAGLVPQLVAGEPARPGDALVERIDGEHHLVLIRDADGCGHLEVTGDDPFFSISMRPGEVLWMRTDGQRTLQVFARVVGDVFRAPASSVFPLPARWYRLAPAELMTGLAWTLRIDPPPGSTGFDACLASADT